MERKVSLVPYFSENGWAERYGLDLDLLLKRQEEG